MEFTITGSEYDYGTEKYRFDFGEKYLGSDTSGDRQDF